MMRTHGMIRQGPKYSSGKRIARSGFSLLCAAGFLAANSGSFAEQLIPLTVERPPTQTIVLTQGFSTPIRSERPFGKISITNPDIVDLVVRTDKSAVLIPKQLGATNIDFVDDRGLEIGSIDIIVGEPKDAGGVLIYDQSNLPSFTAYHCESTGCEYYERNQTKERTPAPTARFDSGVVDIHPQ